MTERPILFSGPMVRAILDGRKTQTRRVVKFNGFHQHGRSGGQVGYSWIEHKPTARGVTCDMQDLLTLCPYGQPVDRLLVREAWHTDTADLDRARAQHEDAMGGNSPIYYRADTDNANCGMSWRPSIHMPRWASRITLEVTGVRVERVQEITNDDARAEGVDGNYTSYSDHWDYLVNFATIWDAINAKRGAGWNANPWVWVIEFRRVEGKV